MLSTPFLMEHTARMALLWSADALSLSRPRTSRSAGQSLASMQRSAAGHKPCGGSSGIDGSKSLELQLCHLTTFATTCAHSVALPRGRLAMSCRTLVATTMLPEAPLPRSKRSTRALDGLVCFEPRRGSSASQAALAYAAGRVAAGWGCMADMLTQLFESPYSVRVSIHLPERVGSDWEENRP